MKSSLDINPFLHCTLLYYQGMDESLLKQHCIDVVSSLASSELITLREEERDGEMTQHYEITNLGRAMHKGTTGLFIMMNQSPSLSIQQGVLLCLIPD